MRKMLAVFIFLITVSGCEKDFLVKEQSGANKMVINSLFNDSGPFTVYLTTSYLAAGSGNINSINDAHIELYENNLLKEVLKYTPSDSVNTFGAYKSLLVPTQGNSYTIKVSEPTYGVVTATDAIPKAVPVASQQLLQFGDSTNGNNVVLDLKIQDDAVVENYYRINIFIGGKQWYLNDLGDTVKQDYYEARGPNTLAGISDTVRDGVFMLFSDKDFNGQLKDLKMEFANLDTSHFYSLGIYIGFCTASKTDYLYQQTLALYRSTKGSSAEPVHVFSNVQNGYGIFAAEELHGLVFVVK